jgi:hypothetical protein
MYVKGQRVKGCKADMLQGSAEYRTGRIAQRIAAIGLLASVIGACSADIGLNNVTFTPNPEPARTAKPDWTTFSGSKSEFSLRPVSEADLVGPEGQCAGGPGQVAVAPGEPVLPASTPTVQGGIALQMTECDVVKRTGVAEKVDIGTNPRGERAVILTVTRGPWPGIYRFDSGRLVSIERAGSPPAPAKGKASPAPRKPAT